MTRFPTSTTIDRCTFGIPTRSEDPIHSRTRSTPGFGHALLAPLVAHIFRLLGVSAAVWEHGTTWFPIYAEPSVVSFEPEHAVEEERYAYNSRLIEEVLRRKRTIRGEHAGYSDLFVPILVGGQVAGILVTGPFALARPTSVGILERWRWLTGRQGQPADAEFRSYLTRRAGDARARPRAGSRFRATGQLPRAPFGRRGAGR